MLALVQIIAPVFLAMALGGAAVRARLITAPEVDALMRLVHGVLVPVLLFRAISTLDLSRSFDPAMMAVFYVSALISFAAGILGTRYLFARTPEESVSVGFCALFSNSLMLGIAITQRAYGPEALAGNFAIVSVHAPICYTAGIIAMETVRSRMAGGTGASDAGRKILRSLLRNPLVVAVATGFALNAGGIALPAALAEALDLIARAAIPLALVALGGVLVRYRLGGDVGLVLFISALALGLHPALVAGLGTLAGLEAASMRAALLTAAMAPGVNAYVFASLYGVGERTAAATVLMATILSVATITGWLAFLG